MTAEEGWFVLLSEKFKKEKKTDFFVIFLNFPRITNV